MNDKELWELISIISEGQDSEQRRKVEQYITDLQKENEQLIINLNALTHLLIKQGLTMEDILEIIEKFKKGDNK